MSFAIMQETTSDDPQLLLDYYGENWAADCCGMFPTVYKSFGDAVNDARQFTDAILGNKDAQQMGEFTVLHSGGIETTFSICQLKLTPSY
jgi:hypothetical protein